jgi:hypothetical protein
MIFPVATPRDDLGAECADRFSGSSFPSKNRHIEGPPKVMIALAGKRRKRSASEVFLINENLRS